LNRGLSQGQEQRQRQLQEQTSLVPSPTTFVVDCTQSLGTPISHCPKPLMYTDARVSDSHIYRRPSHPLWLRVPTINAVTHEPNQNVRRKPLLANADRWGMLECSPKAPPCTLIEIATRAFHTRCRPSSVVVRVDLAPNTTVTILRPREIIPKHPLDSLTNARGPSRSRLSYTAMTYRVNYHIDAPQSHLHLLSTHKQDRTTRVE
jgi:hypothetical protein